MVMKYRILYVFLLFAASLWGCAEDMQYGEDDYIAEEEVSVGVFVKYALSGFVVKSAADEFLVDDINLYVVNESGDVVAYKYYDNTPLANQADGCRIGIDIQKNMKYSLYAVANAGRKIPVVSAGQLDNLVYVISEAEEVVNGSGSVLMAGKVSSLYLADGQTVTVALERCLSKISIRADFGGLDEDVAISINSVALKNIPDRVALFGSSRISEPEQALESAPVCNLSADALLKGIVFYQYENLQGTLQPDNTDYTKKIWPQESIYSKICSYVEMKGTYSSPLKRGDIVYRFYLGSDMTSNYDIKRNAEYRIVVNFNGQGGVDENTWRVDNTEISDLVTDISVMPKEYTFVGLDLSVQLQADVLPVTAANKSVEWSSSNRDIATVDEQGCVTSVSEGVCNIIAASCDGSGASGTCTISVTNPKIAFEEDGRVMYDGEVVKIPYHQLSPSNAEVVVTTDNENAQIVDSDNTGITIRAVTPGTCVVTASTGCASDTYILDIQKLAIEPAYESFVAYNHFYHDIEYAITPAHACGFEIGVSLGKKVSEHVQVCENNRILVSTDDSQHYPDGLYTARLFLKEREDVFADVEFSIAESSVEENIRVVSNSSAEDAVKSIVVNTSPNAFQAMEYTLRGVYGEHTELGNFDDYVDFTFKHGASAVAIETPCAINGKYDLELLAVGDDRKIVHMNSVLEIYEAVYITAPSKTYPKESISQVPFVREYINEMVLKLFATPGSLLYSEGEVDENFEQGFEYEYNGRRYFDVRPDVVQTHRFTFVKGESYPAFPSGIWVFDGKTAPVYYMEFFDIDIINPWVTTGDGKLLYLLGRTFSSGFCDESADWEDVFDSVYSQ